MTGNRLQRNSGVPPDEAYRHPPSIVQMYKKLRAETSKNAVFRADTLRMPRSRPIDTGKR